MSSAGRRLVVDASVARAAAEPSESTGALECARALAAMTTACRVAMGRELIDEWKKHGSHFAMRWLANMVATKRYERVASDAASTMAGLGDAIDETLPTAARRAAAWKDAHMVVVAHTTDRAVVSLDERARTNFALASSKCPALADVEWASPLAPATNAWLKAGAPSAATQRLGATKPPAATPRGREAR